MLPFFVLFSPISSIVYAAHSASEYPVYTLKAARQSLRAYDGPRVTLGWTPAIPRRSVYYTAARREILRPVARRVSERETGSDARDR